MEKQNALIVAGEVVETTQMQVNEVMRGLGRHEALQFMRNGASAALAKQYAILKSANAHTQLGRKSWDEFCRLDLGMDRKTVDGYIAALAEYGEKYFATAKQIRVPVDAYRLIEGHIDDATGEIEIDGEKLGFTKQNAPKIKAFIEAQKRDLGETKEEAARARRSASEAKKALSALKAKDSKLFADASPAQMLIYKAESDFMRAVAELEAAKAHETFNAESDTHLLHLMCQFIWGMVAQVGIVEIDKVLHKPFLNSDQYMAEQMAEQFQEEVDGKTVPKLASKVYRDGEKVKEFRKPQ
jgi:hypothetical protein